MQTILGSGGAIGVELASSLSKYTDEIRLVSRSPEKVNPGDQLFAANLLDSAQVSKAIEGSDIVYLTVGFAYNLAVWQKNWRKCMSYVIEGCIKHQAKLVFFDNIYMYDPNHLEGMTENTPINPTSKKGEIRAEIAAMVLDKIAEGSLTAMIARSADFYGPGIQNSSMLTETVFKPLSVSKKANWLGSLKYKHSFTYTPDAGMATALLGNTADAYGQVWHLPTAANPFTGQEWVNAIAREMGVEPRCQAAPKWMVRIIGMFVPVMREMPEMMYQYDRHYVFNSDKFENRFEIKPTPYLEGIKNIVASDYTIKQNT